MSLGPQVNPFWSGAARNEAILRACRPAHLPQDLPDSFQPVPAAVSPPREMPDAVKSMVQGLLQENARLWSEREAMTAFQGGWSHGSQFPWPQGVWGDGQVQGKGPMGVVMEALRSSVGSSSAHKDKGMLGAWDCQASVLVQEHRPIMSKGCLVVHPQCQEAILWSSSIWCRG